MLYTRISRVLASAVLAGTMVAALSSPAFAAKPGIACKVITGNVTSSVKFKKCTGNTGGGSKAFPAASLTGGTVKWLNGKKTTVALTITSGDPARCAAGTSEYDVVGSTTADTTGSAKIGGAVKASVCVTGTGDVSLAAGTKLTFA